MQAVICLAHSKSQFETLLADHALGTTLQTRLQQQQYRIIQPTSVELVVGWPAIQCYSFFVYFFFYFNIFYLFSLQCCIKLHKLHTNVFTYFTVLLPQLLHVSLSSILHPQRHNRPENLSEKTQHKGYYSVQGHWKSSELSQLIVQILDTLHLWATLSTALGGLGITYDVHIELIGKRVVSLTVFLQENFLADFLQSMCDLRRKSTVLRFWAPLWGT